MIFFTFFFLQDSNEFTGITFLSEDEQPSCSKSGTITATPPAAKFTDDDDDEEGEDGSGSFYLTVHDGLKTPTKSTSVDKNATDC